MSETDIQQIVALTNCGEGAARRAWEKYRDLNRAIDAVFEGEFDDGPSNAVQPYQPPPAPYSWDQQQDTYAETLPGQTPQGPQNRPPSTWPTGDYQNPIDITGDHNDDGDSDLRKAMEMSMKDQPPSRSKGVSHWDPDAEHRGRQSEQTAQARHSGGYGTRFSGRRLQQSSHDLDDNSSSASGPAFGGVESSSVAQRQSGSARSTPEELRAATPKRPKEESEEDSPPRTLGRCPRRIPQERTHRPQASQRLSPMTFGARQLRDRDKLKRTSHFSSYPNGRGSALSNDKDERDEKESSPPRSYALTEYSKVKKANQRKAIDKLDSKCSPEMLQSAFYTDHVDVTSFIDSLPRTSFELLDRVKSYERLLGRKLPRSNARSRAADVNGQMEEDDAIDQALANSMGLAPDQQAAEQADLPELKRPPNVPVALTTHIPVLSTVVQLLQALMSCPSARESILAFQPVDERVSTGMTGYHKGVSPAGKPYRQPSDFNGLMATMRSPFDSTWRLQILTAFTVASARAVCNVGDVIANVPQETLRQNSRVEPAVEVASSYFTHLVSSFYDAFRFLVDTEWRPASADAPEQSSLMWPQLKRTFHLSLVTADQLVHSHTLQAQEEVTHELVLRPDAVASTVSLALDASLSARKQLITEPPSVLALAVRPQAQTLAPGEDFVPFQLETEIYLDRFLLEKRKDLQVGLGLSERQTQVEKSEAVLEALMERKRQLSRYDDLPVIDSLRRSMQYFSQDCQSGGDELRETQQREAAGRLVEIVAKIGAEVSALDERIAIQQEAISRRRAEIVSLQEAEFAGDEWKTHSMRLCAALMSDGDAVTAGSSWVYVRGSGNNWFRTHGDGTLEGVSETELLNDHRGAQYLKGCYYLLYDCSIQGSEEVDEASAVAKVPQQLQWVIEHDNDLLESTLFSLQDSSHGTEAEATADESKDMQATNTTLASAAPVTSNGAGAEGVPASVDGGEQEVHDSTMEELG